MLCRKESPLTDPAGASLARLLDPLTERFEPALEAWLADEAVPAELAQAMRYACGGGGKRLRPALVMLAAEAVADQAQWRADPMPAAVAVEMAHCYSLVHDDLPSMDDDTLRRGRPTVHVQFGEAMAILAGDALLTRAFEVLVRGTGDKALAATLVAELADACGPAGMIAGQVADMALCDVPAGARGREYIHLRKTAAMIRSAARMGGACACADEAAVEALGRYGQMTGLAFQIADDLLDATASAEALGKTPGKDAQAGKRTYATEMARDRAHDHIADLTEQACGALEPFGPRADKLRQLCRLLARRRR